MMYWHEKTWENLLDAQQHQRLSHALLFLGQIGLGKKKLAEKLAQYLLCSSAAKTNTACGKCKDCLWFEAKTHGDFYTIIPENAKSIGIDQIRQIKLDAYQTAQRGQEKIFLIADADKMTTAAANALLKILEEPPLSCTLILTSQSKYALPATILSRCQQYNFLPKYTNEAKTWLSQMTRNEHSSENIELALEWSCGAPLLALNWLEENKINDLQELAAPIQQYLLQEKTAYELIKCCQGKDLSDILHLGYLIAHRLLKNNQITNKMYLYQWLDKINKTKSLLATQIALNEGLLLESLFHA